MPAKPQSSAREPLYRSPDPVDVHGAWFDEAAVEKVLQYGRYCRHTKGRWAGRPIEFDDWQVEHFIRPVFGWKLPDGRRIRRRAFLEVPKKNGKSTKASVLGTYLTGPDGEAGAEVYSAAAAKDQARIVFDPARLMVERSPVLAKHFKKLANTIVYPKTDSVFRVISADANLQDGLNVHGYVVDEVHRHRSRDLIDILDYGTAAREQPLGLLLTTAGDDEDTSIYAELHDYAIKVATGIVNDPSFYGVIYAADAEDDWRDEATWEKANPGLDITVSREYLRQKCAEAEATPAKLNSFLRFHLNVRAKRISRFIALEDWDASAGMVRENDLAGKKCVGGLDIGRIADVATWMLDFVTDAGHTILWRFFVPRDSMADLDERTEGAASGWEREGLLTVTDGSAADFASIRKQIVADAKRFDVQSIAFNARSARQLAQELEDEEGLTLVDMKPGITLAPATQELERRVLAGEYVHGGHRVARWMVDNLNVKLDTEGNAWPDKGSSRDTITGPMAAVMALDRSMRTPPEEEPGLLVSF